MQQINMRAVYSLLEHRSNDFLEILQECDDHLVHPAMRLAAKHLLDRELAVENRSVRLLQGRVPTHLVGVPA